MNWERRLPLVAEDALDVLQNRGHIYYVNEHVRITPTE
jgi:hypothetical protein